MHFGLHQLLLQIRNLSSSTQYFHSFQYLRSRVCDTKSFVDLNGFLYIVLKMFKDNQLVSTQTSDLNNTSNGLSNPKDSQNKAITKLPKAATDVKRSALLAASKIANGNIIAVPTDTIYGLACLVQNDTAVQDLYEIKGRHPNKPVSICVAEIEDIYRWGDVTVSSELLQDLLPGPVTLCFLRKPELNVQFNPDSELVGIRIPDHFFVRELCRKVQSFEDSCSPIALTSANVSGRDSCLEIKEFADTLWSQPNSKLEMIFDGGRLGETRLSRLGSTIIDLSTKGYYKIIRQGSAESNTVKVLKKHGLLEHRI